MPANLSRPDFAAASTGTATSTAIGSLWRRLREQNVTVPALYVAGDRDLVVAFRGMDQIIANLAHNVTQLRGTIILPGCGHWTQQERAAEVNAAIIDFLHRL